VDKLSYEVCLSEGVLKDTPADISFRATQLHALFKLNQQFVDGFTIINETAFSIPVNNHLAY
jgi:hypothetical protein